LTGYFNNSECSSQVSGISMGMERGRTAFSTTAAQVFDEAEQRALINCSLTARYT